MKRVFISGLGLNGKTTLLGKLDPSKYKVWSKSSSELVDPNSTALNQIDEVTKVRFNAYSELSNEYNVIDRCIIDQLAMYGAIGINQKDKSDLYYEILWEASGLFTNDDLIILIDCTQNEDLIKQFDSTNTESRKLIYHDWLDYYIASMTFNTAFKVIYDHMVLEGKYAPRLVEVVYHDWSDSDKVSKLIEEWINR